MPYQRMGAVKISPLAQITLALIGFIVLITIITIAFSAQDEKSTAPNGNIIVFSPKESDAVDNVFVVSGVARVPNDTFNWEVSNASGIKIGSGTTTAATSDSGMFGYYSFSVQLPSVPSKAPVTLSLFDITDGGDRKDTVNMQLERTGKASQAVVVYFTNNMLNPQAADCSIVFPVYRTVPDAPGLARLALEELFKGPTDEESQYGFSTSIPSGVTINFLTLKNGVLRADFSKELESGITGSCYVVSLRAQLTKTLEQFSPSVMKATLSIEGRTQDILEP